MDEVVGAGENSNAFIVRLSLTICASPRLTRRRMKPPPAMSSAMMPSETHEQSVANRAEPAEVISARDDDPDDPALGPGQGAESGEEFLPVEMEMPRTARRLFVHRAKFRIGERACDFRRQIGRRDAQIALEILQLIGRRERA